MDKTIQQILDEMTPEQKIAIYTVVNDIYASGEVKHYGIKGMKWDKRKAQEDIGTLMTSSVLEYDAAKYQKAEDDFKSKQQKGPMSLFGTLKLDIASMKLKARAAMLEARLNGLSVFGKTIKLDGLSKIESISKGPANWMKLK